MATKVWTQVRADGVRQMHESMRLLRTDRIDRPIKNVLGLPLVKDFRQRLCEVGAA